MILSRNIGKIASDKTMLQAPSLKHCQSYVRQNCGSKNKPSPVWRGTVEAKRPYSRRTCAVYALAGKRRHINGSTSGA